MLSGIVRAVAESPSRSFRIAPPESMSILSRMTKLLAAVTTLTLAACQWGGGSDYERPADSTGGAQNVGGSQATGGLGGFGSFDPANPSMTYEVRDPGADMSDCTECVGDTVPSDDTPGLCCHGRQYYAGSVCACVVPDGG
jgi:hypothetical protein